MVACLVTSYNMVGSYLYVPSYVFLGNISEPMKVEKGCFVNLFCCGVFSQRIRVEIRRPMTPTGRDTSRNRRSTRDNRHSFCLPNTRVLFCNTRNLDNLDNLLFLCHDFLKQNIRFDRRNETNNAITRILYRVNKDLFITSIVFVGKRGILGRMTK